MAEPVVSPMKTRGYERDKQAPTKDNTSSINIHVQLPPKSKNRYAQKAFRERIKLDETLYKEYRQFEILRKQKTAPIDINTESDKTSTVPETASSSGYQTKCARRKAVSRSIKILPKNPDKFAEVVATIIKNSTPRKKAALKNKCIASPSSKKN
ncbi:unnamed protein product [Mytilus coruscus]|uniref:Uncharacterized protein n=1 Tax=Mytilus coruscus TaxID=42192 RepID=A0A6J8DDZ0_MYTCO|nr:unnamed protein product [Mytilus coruscus]